MLTKAGGQWLLHPPLPSPFSPLLVNCGTSNELLACIEFCYGIFVCCCRAQARASLSRQSLACIEFHWFMFHMRDESEREASRGRVRESGRECPNFPKVLNLRLWRTLRPVSGLVTMQWLHLLSILPSHSRTSVSCLHHHHCCELASSSSVEERHAFAIANASVSGTVFATAFPLRLCPCSRKCSCRLSLC